MLILYDYCEFPVHHEANLYVRGFCFFFIFLNKMYTNLIYMVITLRMLYWRQRYIIKSANKE